MGKNEDRQTFQTEKITAKSGIEFLLDKFKIYNISIAHDAYIRSICEAIEENAKRK
jgi:hypothetical protein